MPNINILWTGLLAVASAIVLLSNAAEKIIKAIKAARAPNEAQDARISEIEGRLATVERHLNNDNLRLKTMEQEHKAVLTSLLALLDHNLDGNNVAQMQSAKKELIESLTNHN